MNCVACGKETRQDMLVCSEQCEAVRYKVLELADTYCPTKGCENCWGDLHQGCSVRCRHDFEDYAQFVKQLWALLMMR